MLLVPLLIPVIALRPLPVWDILILCVTAVTAFMAQNTISVLQKPHGDSYGVFWLIVFGLIGTAGAARLILVSGHGDLVGLGVLASAIYGLNLLIGRVLHRRMERTVPGEVNAVAAMALTAPASYVVIAGTLNTAAWVFYAVTVLFFMSGVLFVNMLLKSGSPVARRSIGARFRDGWMSTMYHVALAGLIVTILLVRPDAAVAWISIGFLPVILRAFVGVATLGRKKPVFKRVGLREAAYAVWYALFAQAALRIWI